MSIGIEVQTPVGKKVIATEDTAARMRLESIHRITEMQMSCMDLLFKIATHALNAPARNGSPRVTIPKMMADDAMRLVNAYRKEASRWDEDKSQPDIGIG